MTGTFAPEPSAPADELRSLGILGGTFNPPHLGHLAIARSAMAELSLQQVLFVLAATPPHKPIDADPGAAHRLAMCELLAAETEDIAASPLELERGGPSYTVDTLRALHASHADAELTFILGADIAGTLPGWREPTALLELARLAIAPRPGSDGEAVIRALAPLGGGGRVHFLRAPMLDVSSSLVRARAAAGEPIEQLAGSSVASYIHEHGLYGARARGGQLMEPAQLASEVARLAAEKKALDVVELDLRGVLGYTDYFVICSGNTGRQTKAIHDGILEGLKRGHSTRPRRVEGAARADWILMDYLDVIVHIFTPETRDYYRLEELWGEAPSRMAGSA